MNNYKFIFKTYFILLITFTYLKCDLINVDSSCQPSTVNSNSNYSFMIYFSSRILTTDTIVITFPTQIQLPSGNIQCHATSPADSTLKISSCTASSNKLSATVSYTLTSAISIFLINITILNYFKNPPSTYSDNFTLYSNDKNMIVKDYNMAFKPTFTGQTLMNYSLTSSSNVSGEISNLTFKLTPGQPILIGGKIKIVLPCFDQNSGSPTCISLIPTTGINSGTSISTTANSITLNNITPNSNSDTTTQISFTIQNILNPPSTAPFSGFYIYTLDSLSNTIEATNSISLQVSLPSTVSAFSLTTTDSNNTINQLEPLNFMFTTSQFLPNGAILELIFPTEFSISNTVVPSVIGRIYITPAVVYTMSGQTIKMSNAIANYYSGPVFHYFTSSTAPTGNFKFNVYTPDNYLMYSLKFPVNYAANPGLFSNVSIIQSNREINAINSYTFSFINNDIILASSFLKITLPIELQVLNFTRTNCLNIISGISSNAQCEVVSNSILNIYSGFPTYLAANSILNFSLNNVTNYSCAKQTSTFVVASYTSSNYLIDILDNGIFVNFTEGSLLNPKISTDSKINYAISTLRISFANQNTLSINSQIIIVFPITNEIGITDINFTSLNCTISYLTFSFTSNICTINTNTITFNNFNTSTNILSNTLISITLPLIQNPRSFKPSPSLTITTQTSSGCNIDNLTAGLKVTNTNMGSTSSVTLLTSSMMTGDTSNYQFTITPGTQIISGDILQVVFPSQITFPSNSNISVVGITNLSATLQNTSSTTSLGLIMVSVILSITTNCNCVNSTGSISFQIQNLKNPSSLKPTDIFTFNFLTSDSFAIEKYQNNPVIVVTLNTPNALGQTYVKGANIQKNTATDYTFQLMPTNVIPQGGSIVIIYPSQISVMDGSCFAILGLPSTISCQNDYTNKMITLKGGFNLKDFAPSLIQFYVKGLYNNMPIDVNISDSFQVYTSTSDNFKIDQKVDSLNIVFTCISPCATCLGDGTTCLSCNTNANSNPFLQNGKCLSECSLGYSSNGSTNTCVPCNSSCLTCTQDSKDKCISCTSLLLYLPSAFTCVSACPSAFYTNSITQSCVPCLSPCKTCQGDGTTCLSCLPQTNTNNFYLFYPASKTCLAACATGVTVQNIATNTCSDCDPSCLTCDSITTNCTSCKQGKVLNNNLCIDANSCPSNLYADNDKRQCVQCDQNCQLCGNSYYTCKLCNSGYVLNEQSMCVKIPDSCNSGFFLNKESSQCEACSLPCTNCAFQSDFCTTCSQGLLLEKNNCVQRCSDGLYMYLVNSFNNNTLSYIINNQCLPCDSACKTCTGSQLQCTTCANNTYLYNSNCVTQCPIGFYSNQNICATCLLPNCDSCDKDTCNTCNDDYFLYQGKCYFDCPLGLNNDIATGTCLSVLKESYLEYKEKYKFSKTGFIFLFSSVIIVLLSAVCKFKFGQTYFYATCIALIAMLKTFHNIIFAYYAFLTGVKLFFIGVCCAIIMTIICNCIFIVTYDFYSSNDGEFKYWRSNHKLSSFSFFVLSYLIDFKLIRLFYSRLCLLESLTPKFNDYNRIHAPVRKLHILNIIFVSTPMTVFTIYSIAISKYNSDFWFSAIENLLLVLILTLLEIIDLNVNIDLNTDFYNQKVGNPDIIPYDCTKEKQGKYRIEKRFDFDKINENRGDNKKYVKFSSILNTDREYRSNRNDMVSFNKVTQTKTKLKRSQSMEKLGFGKSKLFLEEVEAKKYIDDTQLNVYVFDVFNACNLNKKLDEQSNLNKNKTNNIIEKLSSGIKNFMMRFSISPQTKISPYRELKDDGENEKVQVRGFEPDITTPSFNELDKTERSHIPLNHNYKIYLNK